jgi:hypothetical protein
MPGRQRLFEHGVAPGVFEPVECDRLGMRQTGEATYQNA